MHGRSRSESKAGTMASAGRLDDPGSDQRGHSWCQAAEQGADAEGGQPGDEDPAPSDPVGPAARGHEHGREDDGVAIDTQDSELRLVPLYSRPM